MAARDALVTAAEARRRLLAAVEPLPFEIVAIDAAAARCCGRQLGIDVHAPLPVPAFDRAAVDGFAVRSEDLKEARPDHPITLVCEAGESPGAPPSAEPLPTLRSGRTWPIATGGRTPAGADAVVMLEHANRVGTEVTFTAALPSGRNLIRRGEDVDAGAVLAAAGRCLTPRDLALIGAAGVATVALLRRPRVAVLSTGAEVVPLGTAASSGRVADINQPALLAAVEAGGGEAFGAGIVSDDPAQLAERIEALARDNDLLIVSGGTSVGRADHTRAALDQLGASILFHGVAMRPGRPTMAARLTRNGHEASEVGAGVAAQGPLIIGLPGVPAAAITIFAVFVRPLLARLAGKSDEAPVRARLAGDVASAVGREDYVRVGLETRFGESSPTSEIWAKPLSGSSSSLSALATADGVAVVPTEVAMLPAGALVEVIRF